MITDNDKPFPVDRILSRALNTETGKKFLNDFKGGLSKVVIFGSIAFAIFLVSKFNSWLSRNKDFDNGREG
ncbi:hypothetical protein ES703_89070 [subsurface metagenome]